MDDFEAELRAAFDAELAEHLAAIRAALAEADAGRAIDLRETSRRAHSLKGAARAVSLPATEAAAHEAEELLLAIERGQRVLDRPAVATLRLLADRIEDGAAPSAPAAADAPAPADEGDARLRVSAHNVEALVRQLHDLTQGVQALGELSARIAALGSEVAALVGLAERAGAADLARRLVRAGGEAGQIAREQAALLGAIDRGNMALERAAERILLLPIATLFQGHERMVRELAESRGRAATLRIDAEEGEADRRILQGLRDPLLHLLRNAVGHGIEPAAARATQGKPPAGEILIDARVARGRLALTISDDGAGLDYGRIEARARAAGLIGAGDRPDRAALRALLFHQNFTTAQAVDEVSGRGIGLSVVADTVRRLHGSVSITDRAGGGTVIALSVPVALSRQTLLLVEAGGGRYAVPAAAVVRLLAIPPASIGRDEDGAIVMIDGEAVPLIPLGALLGRGAADPHAGDLPAFLLAVEERRAAVMVDRLDEVRMLLVGDPDAIAAEAPLVNGTVLLEDGVALVIDPAGILARRAQAGAALAIAPAADDRPQRTILVVDDSITTRTLEKSILEAQGYRVLIAVDGLAGLERLRAGMDRIDLVVADVEMPRMDGFGLLTAIRNDPALGTLPVVMMTSRNSPDDIQRGLDLGASAYVTKQEFDQGTLLSVIQQLV